MRRTTAKARRATGFVKDAFRDRWDISEFRGTKHGFDIVLRWPSGKRRGTGGEGLAVRYLERFRTNVKGIDLPISPKLIVRLRGLSGSPQCQSEPRAIARYWRVVAAD